MRNTSRGCETEIRPSVQEVCIIPLVLNIVPGVAQPCDFRFLFGDQHRCIWSKTPIRFDCSLMVLYLFDSRMVLVGIHVVRIKANLL